jgi:hypothetical protein
MNYPNNGIKLGDINFSNYGNKILIKIGLEDSDNSNIITFFNKLIPMLTVMKKNKILFDTVKSTDSVFFKEMMLKFTEKRSNFKKD